MQEQISAELESPPRHPKLDLESLSPQTFYSPPQPAKLKQRHSPGKHSTEAGNNNRNPAVTAPEGQCPFCHIETKRIVLQNEHGFAVRDGFPVSEGHSLIIPKRHVGSFFDLTTEEQHALLELLNQCKKDLCTISLCSPASLYRHPEPPNRHSGPDPESIPLSSRAQSRDLSPDLESSTSQSEVKVPSSFNIGINDGPAAGQTVPHCHIHLIPRYIGDVEDPRGGVRWVVPEKADYWSGR